MAESTQVPVRSANDILRSTAVQQANNGVCFANVGETRMEAAELERLAGAVPHAIARALDRKAFYFVPLTISGADEVTIAERYDAQLSDQAVCHRNLNLGDSQFVFISTRLSEDRFSVAFEFFINVAHAFVERAGVAHAFEEVAWKQVKQRVRGETSLDAWELRRAATGATARGETETAAEPINGQGIALEEGRPRGGEVVVVDERAKTEYLETAFADSIAIYMLSLYLDVDYYELREREYPLLAPAALAERLKKISELFPANPGYEFNIVYRRRQS
jgi:hypothetical protein